LGCPEPPRPPKSKIDDVASPGAAQTPKNEDVVWSGSGWFLGRPGPPKPRKSKVSLRRGWPVPPGATQTSKSNMSCGRCGWPGPLGAAQTPKTENVLWSGSGWPGPPGAAQARQIEDVAWSGPGWPGPPGAAQIPNSKTSFGRGSGRPGPPGAAQAPQNRRCRSVRARLASGFPGAAQTPKIEDIACSGSCWPGPPRAAQTPTSKMALGRGPAGFRAAGPRTWNIETVALSGSGWLGPPGPSQVLKIEDGAWSWPGWFLGRPGLLRLPKSKMSLGRGPAGFGAARGRQGPHNRRCLGSGWAWVPGAAQTPRI
jgi:hypothetical protein